MEKRNKKRGGAEKGKSMVLFSDHILSLIQIMDIVGKLLNVCIDILNANFKISLYESK